MQSTPLYHTAKGEAYVGNSLELLAELPDKSIDLVMTSPPFAPRRQKSYGNVEETEYVQWIKSLFVNNFDIFRQSIKFLSKVIHYHGRIYAKDQVMGSI